jgi:hypothetical protein
MAQCNFFDPFGTPNADKIKSASTTINMAQCNFFEPSFNTSSATKYKWCGMEKYFHVPINNMAQQRPDLKKLEEKFEDLFKEETEESFNKWLADKQQNIKPNNMAQQNNKYAPYILSTVGYIIVVMFVLGDKETTVADRFFIIWVWMLWMAFIALESHIKNL